MKVKNGLGFPQCIKECGEDRVIPADNKVYTVDDSCYGAYKDLLVIIEPPPPKEVRIRRAKEKAKKARKDKKKQLPLYGKEVKTHLKEYNHLYTFCKKNGCEKKNKWRWIIISPNGKKYKVDNIREWCEKNNWSLHYMYFLANNPNRKYRGWVIKRRVKKEFLRNI